MLYAQLLFVYLVPEDGVFAAGVDIVFEGVVDANSGYDGIDGLAGEAAQDGGVAKRPVRVILPAGVGCLYGDDAGVVSVLQVVRLDYEVGFLEADDVVVGDARCVGVLGKVGQVGLG